LSVRFEVEKQGDSILKVAIFTPGFSRDERDWCIPFVYHFVRALARLHEVHVFAIRYPTQRGSYRFFDATVHAIGGHHAISGIKRLGLWAQTAADFRAEQRRAPFDVIHAIWADETGFLARELGAWFGVPSVVAVTGGELVHIPEIGYGLQKGRGQRWMVGRALRADTVIAPSGFQVDLIQKIAPGASVRVAPFGVNTDLFCPSETPREPSQPPKLIAVGSLIPVKDHALLLRAFARLQTPDVQLEIAGEGRLQPELERLARELGIADRVTFAGKVDHGDLPRHYHAADLHILTSHHDGFALVIAEAAACGVPTVGFRLGVLPEMHAAGGGVVTDRAIEPLAREIDALLQDDQRRREMSAAALILARAEYSTDAMVNGALRVYADMLQTRKRGR
jgi:glycosyltransferase involved in cell wall biosynthesis